MADTKTKLGIPTAAVRWWRVNMHYVLNEKAGSRLFIAAAQDYQAKTGRDLEADRKIVKEAEEGKNHERERV